MSNNDRILVLVSGARTRRYPLLAGRELKDEYYLDGRWWTVTAVLSSEDVPLESPLTSTR